jgi:predicted alpha/beta-fold hydrolase
MGLVGAARAAVLRAAFFVLHAALHVALHAWPRCALRAVAAAAGAAAAVVAPIPVLCRAAPPLNVIVRWAAPCSAPVAFVAASAAHASRLFGLPLAWAAAGRGGECCAAQRPFAAPRYNAHLSTVLGAFRPAPRVRYERDVMVAADGCDVALDWAFPDANGHAVAAVKGHGAPPAMRRPCVGVMAVLVGLTSSARSNYVESFVRAALTRGFAVVVANMRGAADGPGGLLTRPTICSAAFTSDVRCLVGRCLTGHRIRERCGRAVPAVMVGFSLGGNVLAKYLSEEGANITAASCVVGAAAISAPWELHRAHLTMAGWPQRLLYWPALTAGLRRILCANAAVLQYGAAAAFDWDAAMRSTSVLEFEAAVVVPHCGYRSVAEYYAVASCMPRLPAVRVPLLCLATCDDPITGRPPSRAQWQALADGNPRVVYGELPAGGHLGNMPSPLQQLRQRPNAVEEIVCGALLHCVVHAES